MVGTTQGNEGNGAEPRRPKKNRPKGPAKTSKAEALAQLVVRPDLATNVSAAVRLWGVSRSTARTWMAERAAMAVPPEPPLAEPAAMAASSPRTGHRHVRAAAGATTATGGRHGKSFTRRTFSSRAAPT